MERNSLSRTSRDGRNGKVSPARLAGRCAVGLGILEGLQLKRGGGTWGKQGHQSEESMGVSHLRDVGTRQPKSWQNLIYNVAKIG